MCIQSVVNTAKKIFKTRSSLFHFPAFDGGPHRHPIITTDVPSATRPRRRATASKVRPASLCAFCLRPYADR